MRPVDARTAGGDGGESPSHGWQASSLASERHIVHREGLRLPCLQRELPTQLPLLQSYLLRLCSQIWLPRHPSLLHLYLFMPCGLQKPLPQRSLPHLHHCSLFKERGQM